MKKILYKIIPFVIFLSVVSGCISYKRVSVSSNEPFGNKKIKENFSYYNVYIHDDYNTYKVNNPSISEEIISGELILVESAEEIKAIKEIQKIRRKDNHKYDLNIYTKKAINDSLRTHGKNNFRASNDKNFQLTDGVETSSKSKFELHADDIENVEMYASDEKSVGLIVLFVVLGVLAIGLIIWGTVILSTQGSNGSNSGSNNSGSSGSSGGGGSNSGGSSGGGGSNSGGSNSGGSNSGGSNSGGSGSGGSCYIATMVYGSYEAPEVLVLRAFRDNFLDKFYLGRRFISFYYKYSPLLVEKLRDNKSAHKPIRFLLNKFVSFLSK